MTTPTKKIAVVGTGCSGLAAIKICLDEGLEPVGFERTGTLGGLWRYTDEPEDGQACVMKSTTINTSKEMMCYSDFPIPGEYSVNMHNTEVMKYFHLYADHFGLKKYIRFNTEIVTMRKTEDFALTGQWELLVKNRLTGEEWVEIYDGVMACTGHHADKYTPTFPGQKDFKGKIIHSHDYRVPDPFKDKKVMVVGIGNSGADLATELSRTAARPLLLSTRSGCWIFARVGPGGKPIDFYMFSRFTAMLQATFPKVWGFIGKQVANQRLDHDMACLTPNFGPFQSHPTGSDELPNRLMCGAAKVKGDIKRFTRDGVEFVDGSYEDIDVAFMATGYSIGFKYIPSEITEVKDNHVKLYKYMFPPELEKHTLGIIACVQTVGAIIPAAEMQSRVFCKVVKGEITLPSTEDMWEDIREKEETMSRRYKKSRRHTIQVDIMAHLDEMSSMIGAKPDLWDLFFRDPKLWAKVLFGAGTPYQYRLYGPGKWEGARNAIMTQEDRMTMPLKTRKIPTKANNSFMSYFWVLAVLVLIFFISHYILKSMGIFRIM